MGSFLRSRNIKRWLAGSLAAVILASPLTGCQSRDISKVLNSAVESSPLSSMLKEVSSQISSATSSKSSSAASKKAISSAVSAVVNSKAAAKAPAAVIKPKQKVAAKKAASSKVDTGNQSIKKIAIDQANKAGARLAVTQSKPAAAAYARIDERSGYNYLSSSVSRTLYSQIMQSVYKVTQQPTSQGYYPTERITVKNAHLSEAQLRIAMMAFLNDNPQVFWLANVYSYGYTDSDTIIQLYSVVSQSQCNAMIQQLNQKVGAVIHSMPSGLSQLDREIFLADYLVRNNVYDTAAVTDTTRWKAFTSYGALVEGSVVCEGYSRAMQLLSSYAGLQCMLITGQSGGVNHMWNLMQIDGNWYHLDNTWDDNDPQIYNYFNVTDSVIEQTHTVFPTASSLTEAQIDGSDGSTPAGLNLAMPACNATAANYFYAKGIHIAGLSGANDSAAVSAVAAAAKQKKESVSFYIETGADYDQTIAGMVKGAPYKLVGYITGANRLLGGNVINLGGIKYIQDPSDRGLTVFLSYNR